MAYHFRAEVESRLEITTLLKAFCDESYEGGTKTPPLYVVAGFVADATNCEAFNERWKQSMCALQIEKIGCHASQVAQGTGAYRDMTPQRRTKIQETITEDIVASSLSAVISIVDLEAYRSHRKRFAEFLGKDKRKYNEPHILAVDQCVFQMCRLTDHRVPIAFVLDRNNEFKGRVEEWHRIARWGTNHKYHKRLGPLVHDDRMRSVGLQAADYLAYWAFRNVSGRSSWQWEDLNSALEVVYQERTGPEFWKDLADRLDRGRSSAN